MRYERTPPDSLWAGWQFKPVPGDRVPDTRDAARLQWRPEPINGLIHQVVTAQVVDGQVFTRCRQSFLLAEVNRTRPAVPCPNCRDAESAS